MHETDSVDADRRTVVKGVSTALGAGLVGSSGVAAAQNNAPIEYWLFGGIPQERTYIKDHYDAYGARPVRYTHQSWGNKYQKIASAASTNSLPDVFAGQCILIPDYRALDAVQPLTDFQSQLQGINDRFVQANVEALTYEGAQYALPGGYSDLGPFVDINESMMQEAGFQNPPRTWDELVEYAVEMQKLDGVDAGIAVPAANTGLTADNFEGFLYQNGGRYYDPESMEATVTQPGFVDALGLYQRFADEGVLPDAISELNYIDCGRLFMEERAAMFVTLSHAPAILATINPPPKFQDAKNQIVTRAPLPDGPSGQFEPVTVLLQNAQGFMLSSGAQNGAGNQAAFDYMDWWHRPAQLEPWTYRTDVGIRGRIPTLKSAWTDPADLFTQQYGDIINLYQQDKLFTQIRRFPSFSGLAQITDLLNRNAIQPVLAGRTTAEDALNAIESQVQGVIDENLAQS